MYIDNEAALEIYYYMIAVDGEVKQAEMDKFIAIIKESNDSISDMGKEEIREELDEFVEMCNQRLETAIDEDEYFEVIKERIDEIKDESARDWSSYDSIEASGLIWNLLSIAVSDKEYSEVEKKLIRYMVRKFQVDKTVYLEMENAMKAIQDINKEIDFLKQSDKPYTLIESMIGTLSERQKVIFDSVKVLITDNMEV